MSVFDLSDRVAIVTGGTGGVGLVLARGVGAASGRHCRRAQSRQEARTAHAAAGLRRGRRIPGDRHHRATVMR